MCNGQSLWIRLESFSNLSLKAASSSVDGANPSTSEIPQQTCLHPPTFVYNEGAFAGGGCLDDIATRSTTPNLTAPTVGDTQLNSPPPQTPNPTGAFVGEGGLDDLGTGSTTPISTVGNIRQLPTPVLRSPNFLINESGKRRGARKRRVPARLGSMDYRGISSLVQDVQATPSPTGPSSLLVHEGTTPTRLEGPSSFF